MDENSIIEWLLESPTASIRYKTLRDLVHLPAKHPECLETFAAIQSQGVVPAILNQQVELGRWHYPQHYYTPKYTSTHWSMMLLEELLCDPEDERFQAAVEFMLSSTHKQISKYTLDQNTGWTCLWGNIIRYCVYAGKWADPRLQSMLDLTAKSLLNKKCNCEWNWQMPCVWGAARSIWGLILIPKHDRSNLIEEAIHSGLEFVLENVNLIIAEQPNPAEHKTHQIWNRLNFPLFYQADILFVLRLLLELDELHHPLAANLLTWLRSKQKPNGRWQGSSPFRQRTYPELGDQEETARWVSLQAASILRKVSDHA